MNKNYLSILAITLLVILGLYFTFLSRDNKREVANIPANVSTTTTNDRVTNAIPQEEISSIDVFTAPVRPSNISNVVGYFGDGAFTMYVPDWLSENWRFDTDKGGSVTTFSPKVDIPNKDFSNIVITVLSTIEFFNAESLYEKDKKDALNAELILNEGSDMRVYHIEKRAIGSDFINETFYVDGKGKTAVITFSASEKNYFKYSSKVKEFIKGLGKSSAPRG